MLSLLARITKSLLRKGTIMGFTSIWHWIIVLAVVLILFARPGKIGIMGDFAKASEALKKG